MCSFEYCAVDCERSQVSLSVGSAGWRSHSRHTHAPCLHSLSVLFLYLLTYLLQLFPSPKLWPGVLRTAVALPDFFKCRPGLRREPPIFQLRLKVDHIFNATINDMSLIGLYSHQDCPSILLSFQRNHFHRFTSLVLLSNCPSVVPSKSGSSQHDLHLSFTSLHFWQSLNDNIISITVQCSTSITAQGKQWEGIPKMIRIVFLMHCPMDIFFHLICRSLKFVCSWFLPTRPQNLQVFQSSPKPCDTSSRIPYNLIPSSSHPCL